MAMILAIEFLLQASQWPMKNIFHNYNDTDPAVVTFTLSNKNKLILFFGRAGILCDDS